MSSLIKNRRGVALIYTFIILIGLSGISLAFLTMFSDEIRSTGAGLFNMEAFYIAEAGRAKARWALTTGGQAVGWGETAEPFGTGKGTYVVTTAYSDPPTNQYVIITSDGYIPDNTNYAARRRVVETNIALASAGTNLSLSATASASSQQGGNEASQANDGNIHSKWKSNVKNGSWLKLDFGSSITFNKIIVYDDKIDSYSLQYSNDDSAWYAVTNPSGTIPGTLIFDSTSARYLRINVNGNKPEIREFETYNASSLGQGKFVTSW